MSQFATCPLTGREFEILDQELALCTTMGIPLPILSPEERIRELMATRNERKLYHRSCDATGEPIISAYHADVPFPVYKNAIWWGGGWDAREHGREYDFEKTFFEQFAALQSVVPREGTSIFNSENCDFNSHVRSSKNCYMNSLAVGCEDVHYCYWVLTDKDIMDSMYTHQSSLCYECSDVNEAYHCIWLQESVNCHDCFFSFQLRGCNHCLFCSNLANKSYYAFNQPCTKEEFAALEAKIFNGSYQNWQQAREQYLKLRAEAIHRAAHNINCENVSGDHLYNSKNLVDCFDASGNEGGNEDCSHVISLGDSKNIHSCYSVGWPSSEMIYRSAVIRGCTDIAFGRYIFFSNALRYCDSCVSCHDCFGCIGLHHREYCILNRQYTKEEYFALLPKIINHLQKTGEWGQFFPPALSAFAYNETSAQEYFPFSAKEAIKRGWRWRAEEEPDFSAVTRKIPTKKLPDALDETPDDILNWALECAESKRLFKIQKAELAFYRKMRLPIPRLHPDIRHQQRMSMRNPFKLWKRNCMKCQKSIETTYAPERPETVYCEQCYLQAIS